MTAINVVIAKPFRQYALEKLKPHVTLRALQSEIWALEDRGPQFPAKTRYLITAAYPDQSPARVSIAADALDPWVRAYAACRQYEKTGNETALNAMLELNALARAAEKTLKSARSMRGSSSARMGAETSIETRDVEIRAAVATGETRKAIGARLQISQATVCRAMASQK